MSQKQYHEVNNIRVSDGWLHLVVDGDSIQRHLQDISDRLVTASEKEQNTFEVSPSGYGIYWPLVDEDLSIDGLIGRQKTQEYTRWAA